jgi:hypothetical protein
MAATYPGDVADAATWSKANPKATGDAAVRQVADQPWDPSVQSLAAFPQVLSTLGQDPAWVQRLGDAFLAQPDDVMDAVQVLRHKAKDAGNLATNEYQNVSVQPAAPEPAVYEDSGAGAVSAPVVAGTTDTIVIAPSDPQVVYVPSYNPTTAYGTWAYPSYPPPYYPPSPAYYAGSALVRGLAWGTGVAIADSLWGDMDWNGNDVNVNVARYNNINVNRQLNASNNTWRHDSLHRDGVPYRDQRSRDQFANRLPDSGNRDRMRGDDAQRAQAREKARQSMGNRGMEQPARTNREAQDRAQRARQDIAREGGRAEAGGRDAARDRAQGSANRDAARNRAQGTANRDAARNRAEGAGNRDAARNRAQGTGNRAAGGGRQHANAPQHRQQGAGNNASRNAARQQAQRQQRPHNDAFSGARQPQQSRSAAQRGHASQGAARQQRPQQSHQVNRAPRGGGGAQHAQAQRPAGGAHAGGGRRR